MRRGQSHKPGAKSSARRRRHRCAPAVHTVTIAGHRHAGHRVGLIGHRTGHAAFGNRRRSHGRHASRRRAYACGYDHKRERNQNRNQGTQASHACRSDLSHCLQVHFCGSSHGWVYRRIGYRVRTRALSFFRPLKREPPDHGVIAEAGADAVHRVLGDCSAAVDQVGGIGLIRRDQRA
jgi:hypothetical protein